ncbi:hypothetical protein EYF80_020540 [Liparis tanakae]|uniref:Uncharacterized protein n=1 Tax=Liparis tanakae TaxID=230148 RepID=A0A4Z2HW75_9TELE|nr:hypothetical protein EYF80_020540 [Liparis tanakae]
MSPTSKIRHHCVSVLIQQNVVAGRTTCAMSKDNSSPIGSDHPPPPPPAPTHLLRSRWMMGWVRLCRYSMPLATSMAMMSLDCSRENREPPDTYWVTMANWLGSSRHAPTNGMMQGWLRRQRMETSLQNMSTSDLEQYAHMRQVCSSFSPLDLLESQATRFMSAPLSSKNCTRRMWP